MLQRYSDIDYIMKMDIKRGMDLIIKAVKEKQREKIWQLYLTVYPYMTNEEIFVSFDEFYKQRTEDQQTDQRSSDEILDDVENIMNNTCWESK